MREGVGDMKQGKKARYRRQKTGGRRGMMQIKQTGGMSREEEGQHGKAV